MIERPLHCESCPLMPSLDESLPRPPRVADCPGPTFVLEASAVRRLSQPLDPQVEEIFRDLPRNSEPSIQIRINDDVVEPERICGREYTEAEQTSDRRTVVTHRGINGLAQFAVQFSGPNARVANQLSERSQQQLVETAVGIYWRKSLGIGERPLNHGQMHTEKLFFQTDSLGHDIEAVANDMLVETNLNIARQAFGEAQLLLQSALEGSQSEEAAKVLGYASDLQDKVERAMRRNQDADESLREYLAIIGQVSGGAVDKYSAFLDKIAPMLDKRQPVAGAVDLTAIGQLSGRLNLAGEVLRVSNFGIAKAVAVQKRMLINDLLNGSIRPEAEQASQAAADVVGLLGATDLHLRHLLHNLEKYIASI